METDHIIGELRALLDILTDEITQLQTELVYLRAVQSEMALDFKAFRQNVTGRADHLRDLIVAHSRRLLILELQQAHSGSTTEPKIIMEIQDVRTELEKLRWELRNSETDSDYLKAHKTL